MWTEGEAREVPLTTVLLPGEDAGIAQIGKARAAPFPPFDTGNVPAPGPTASVVVATCCRPDHLRICLQHLDAQTLQPLEIVVVDASPDERTRRVVNELPGIRYLRNERGVGSTATSRAIGLAATRGEIVAYVDDDAFAAPEWLQRLLLPYQDESVAAVGGRARNGRPGEETEGLGSIGRLLPDGRLTGNFAADPGHDVDTDHLLGANMSYRRSVVERLGGIHDHYPGTCLREETDIALRMRRAGYRVVYTPSAVVDHVAGAYARGRRFDLRYAYYGQRNHVVLLARTLGATTPHLRRYWHTALREAGDDLAHAGRAATRRGEGDVTTRIRAVGGGVSRAGVKLAGLTAGGAQALRLRIVKGPVRRPRGSAGGSR